MVQTELQVRLVIQAQMVLEQPLAVLAALHLLRGRVKTVQMAQLVQQVILDQTERGLHQEQPVVLLQQLGLVKTA